MTRAFSLCLSLSFVFAPAIGTAFGWPAARPPSRHTLTRTFARTQTQARPSTGSASRLSLQVSTLLLGEPVAH